MSRHAEFVGLVCMTSKKKDLTLCPQTFRLCFCFPAQISD